MKSDDTKLKAAHEELEKKYEELFSVNSKNEQKLKSVHKLEEDFRSMELMKEELLEKLHRSDTLWAAEVQAVQMKIDAEKESHIIGKFINFIVS